MNLLSGHHEDSLQLSAIANALPFGVILTDHTGLPLYANPAAHHLLGDELLKVARQELCYRKANGSTLPNSFPLASVLAGHAQGSGDFLRREALIGQSTDIPRWLRLETAVLTDGVETSLLGLIVCSDITELKQTQQYYQSLFDLNLYAVYSFDLKKNFLAANTACEKLMGYPVSELLRMSFVSLMELDDLDIALAQFDAACAGRPESHEYAIQHKDGHSIDIEVSTIPMIVGGNVVGVHGTAKDITKRKQAERQLQESRQRYKSLFEYNVDAVYSFDLKGNFLTANQGCEALSGYSVNDLLNMSFIRLVVPEDRECFLSHFTGTCEGDAQHYEIAIQHGAGHRVHISVTNTPIVVDGAIVGVYGIAKNISDRKAVESERERLLAEAIERADRDPLTGLCNHRVFHKRFEEEAERAARQGTAVAVVVMDLDNFKFFNDAYGHSAGDEVLRKVADALTEACRGYDVLARFGGDEFAVLMPGIEAGQAPALIQRLHERLSILAYTPSGLSSEIPLSLTMGLAVYPSDAATRMEVLELADQRLLRAKSGGRNDDVERLRAVMSQSLEGFSMLDALVTAVDNKDRYTRRHSEDVTSYCMQIAQELGLDDALQHQIQIAALLHDVGKIGVPDSVLRKPDKLTVEEYEVIKRHPMMGVVIVGAVPGLEYTLDAIQHHHERWDGSGYPFGLVAEETPLMARVMAVGDAFSAMTSDRPYRKGMSPEAALSILESGAGAQWDPMCVAAFRNAMRKNAAELGFSEKAHRPSYNDVNGR